jgi:hypothetical protein
LNVSFKSQVRAASGNLVHLKVVWKKTFIPQKEKKTFIPQKEKKNFYSTKRN